MKDVIVQDKKTGHKKSMTLVMAKNLSHKYSVVDAETEFKPPVETNELDELRKQYFNKFGQQPHHRLGIERLKQLITE